MNKAGYDADDDYSLSELPLENFSRLYPFHFLRLKSYPCRLSFYDLYHEVLFYFNLNIDMVCRFTIKYIFHKKNVVGFVAPQKQTVGLAWLLSVLCMAAVGCAGSTQSGEALTKLKPKPESNSSWLAMAAATDACRNADIAVQVLGSGGPKADDARGGSAYGVWHQGKMVALVDVGPGTTLRMGQLGMGIDGLEALLISHFHVDHSGDLPALLKSAYFGARTKPLPVIGPEGRDRFIGLNDWLEALFGAKRGAYAYLSGFLGSKDYAPFVLQPTPVAMLAADALAAPAKRVWGSEDGAIVVKAVSVPHGPVPALAFLLEVDGLRIVFGGDQRLGDAAFEEIARGVDLLVLHHAIGENTGGPAAKLHASPSVLAAAVAHAQPGRLVLSHHMQRALKQKQHTLRVIRKMAGDDRQVSMAHDGACYVLRDAAQNPK